ncbi:hypothetical protein [Gorillibacterium sp. sgz5001074]|uniref:hypothetical protein n=1 Tax=Gorillibacterium sp. sgz5001074 TaxID=3446695 RepID=UPI003F6625D7
MVEVIEMVKVMKVVEVVEVAEVAEVAEVMVLPTDTSVHYPTRSGKGERPGDLSSLEVAYG